MTLVIHRMKKTTYDSIIIAKTVLNMTAELSRYGIGENVLSFYDVN